MKHSILLHKIYGDGNWNVKKRFNLKSLSPPEASRRFHCYSGHECDFKFEIRQHFREWDPFKALCMKVKESMFAHAAVEILQFFAWEMSVTDWLKLQ